VHQGVAEQDSKIPSSEPSLSQRRISSVRGRGVSSSGARDVLDPEDLESEDFGFELARKQDLAFEPEDAAESKGDIPVALDPKAVQAREPGVREGGRPWFGLDVRWSRRPGWIAFRDPFTGEWDEVRAADCPEWYIRATGERRQH
jgi:hypothetical protein